MGDKLTKRDLERVLSTAIADYSVSRLGRSTDDGSSDVLAVVLTLHTGKQVQLVAKVYPEDSGADTRMRWCAAMRREIDVYLLAIPECRKIQEELDVPPKDRLDVFCSCPAARATTRLRSDDEGALVGEDSVLLLEDLEAQGYVPGDVVGDLGLRDAEFVVTQLARFHATAIALKATKPLVFRNKVVRALTPSKPENYVAGQITTRLNPIIEILKDRTELKDLVEKFDKLVKEEVGYQSPVQPFATIVHNDFRRANMMFKYDSSEDDGLRKILGFKIVNFCNARYGSPVSDLIFFIFTSIKSGVVLAHVDSLLRLYHETFLGSLSAMNCDVRKFLIENFTKELKIFAAHELPRITSFLVLNHCGGKIETRSNELLTVDDPTPNIGEDFIQRISEIVKLFDSKGWLT